MIPSTTSGVTALYNNLRRLARTGTADEWEAVAATFAEDADTCEDPAVARRLRALAAAADKIADYQW